MKPNIWIFGLEPIDSRYTKQWYDHIPLLLSETIDNYTVIQIDGVQTATNVSQGAFLNFADTNLWKSSQLCNFIEYYFNTGFTTSNDKFLFTDAWNANIIQLAYMRDLLDFNWEFHGIWHAGAYDPSDILGYKMKKPWPWSAETSFYHIFDYNYFATEFHRSMFVQNLKLYGDKAVVSGQPYEYLNTLLNVNFDNKRIPQVIWPHRYNADKQPEIIESLAEQFNYQTIITQKLSLTKDQYYQQLGQSSVIFSCSLHENLGVSMAEGVLAGVIPVVPDRCSYSEMYLDCFKYPSHWTESFDHYKHHQQDLIDFIDERVYNYDSYTEDLIKQRDILVNQFLNSNIMIGKLSK